MKKGLLIFVLSLIAGLAWAQQNVKDSLLNIINLQKRDTNEVNTLVKLVEISRNDHSRALEASSIDTLFNYLQKGLELSRKLKYLKGEADCYFQFGEVNLWTLNNHAQHLSYMFKALPIYENLKDKDRIALTLILIQGTYREDKDYRNSLTYAFAAKKIIESGHISHFVHLIYEEIGQTYVLMNVYDSALLYLQKAIQQNHLINGAPWGMPTYLLGKMQERQSKYGLALETFHYALRLAKQNQFARDTSEIYNSLAALYKKTGRLDSAIYYSGQIANNWNKTLPVKILLESNNILTEAYRVKGNVDSALKYIELRDVLKDSIFTEEKEKEIQRITFNEKLRQQELLSAQSEYKKKVRLYILYGGLIILVLLAGILWRNIRNKQKAYNQLEKQKRETDIQKIKVEETLEELKATQSQLIHSEKMASLGELTAGIAHEIQNPLNFVNNFSEVNRELIGELKVEIKKGNIEEVNILADDIEANAEKINHHGKRADAIVKGMLQHSRTSSSMKEPTDINALADEYLRLAYHGLRAKDNTFNANMKTDFDEKIGNIKIIAQDIGRVLLNLYNNAFYAVAEKKKQQPQRYEPLVSVSTKKIDNKIEIRVKDNGNGIPRNISDKIFQPFFTTKPTGQGTGLGLSLAYDIVKTHGGELKVETKEGEGSEFIIQIPN